MSNEKLIHVQLDEPTEEEITTVRELIEDALNDWEHSGTLVVSGSRMSIGEVPALDDYADDLADRIAARLDGDHRLADAEPQEAPADAPRDQNDDPILDDTNHD